MLNTKTDMNTLKNGKYMGIESKQSFLGSNEIRRQFLDYFREHGHEIVPSSSLIPANDPTLLFTNAGMVQFKDVFLGKEERPYHRAASSQRCVRAGGKHNDLERVGYTARHHTFFEMLGNFSFGDYFKREAIHFAWEFLTKKLGLPPEKLWVSVFEDDKEAEAIWLNEMKIDPARFSRCGEHDNFWSMGPTGPCGPCTEIFYDHGAHIPGGPPGSEDADGDRYIEIWNLVFMQYDRAADGTLTPLPKPSVDTGMGLERISAVMQGVHNNYDTDLFQPLIKTAAELADIRDLKNFSLRVIADHIRSCSFLITDGVLPSNEGRGYVLRRIIRRALRHGNKLGITQPFFYRLVEPLVVLMGDAYPELVKAQAHVEKVLLQEEEQFSVTLSQGLKLFEQVVHDLKGDIIPGETVFKLYDTYGFPADLTADIARERNLLIDYEGFETAMSKQRERSRQASQFTAEYTPVQASQPPTEFIGHKNLLAEPLPDTGKILALYRDGKFVDALNAGEKGSIVLDRTPFYAESGGQVGDQGLLRIENQALFKVLDTIKQGHTHLHLGKLEKGTLRVGDEVLTEVDAKRRAATVLNHTATHLLHLVLRQVLGEHAVQKGSLVEPERLRFDFVHASPLTDEELRTVERRVNDEIRANYEGVVRVTTPQEAVASGAVALFGEKYGSKVRVVSFGPSVELCGGTHADHTGDIGIFKITAETGVAAGVRRIEAVTGDAALRFIEKREDEFKQKLSQKEERILQMEKDIQQLKDKLAGVVSQDLASQAKMIGNIKVLAAKVEGLDGKALRHAMDHLKQTLGSAVIVLATVKENKVGIVGGVTADLVDRLNAKEIVNSVAIQVGGKGGGRADLAEAGGNKPEALEKALQSIYTWVQEKG
ncbi:Alanine--tRNA ligase [Aquicella lusitana]|uniref:Alanine--tRNA ligase n=2 Tax=Aquicella lusitana TaxID=254246 RepID=A0A370GHZ7_9COXI|nr:alanyl-tRNA synthetase [Aquicella lusitana]VVC73052.1 Alanine--tRNA ligase [Aquicella lusitana]